MPVRPLILSPPIVVRALRGDPADLLVCAGGGEAATARTARTFQYDPTALVYCYRVKAILHSALCFTDVCVACEALLGHTDVRKEALCDYALYKSTFTLHYIQRPVVGRRDARR